jgi:hypothetical protein
MHLKMSKIDSETKKNYANEHPRGKKPSENNTIKLAKSQQMKIREKKLQSLFEEEVEKRELLYGDMVDEFEQNKIYKRLEKKILGRNK